MGFEESFTAFTTGVGEKFKGNTEVMKLRSQINSEQKQVDELFKNLGRKYYEMHKESEVCDPSLQETVDAIRFHESKIFDMEKRASEIRQATDAVSLTPQPGTEYGGTPKSTVTTGPNSFCTKCGAPIKPEQVFCIKCGSKLT